MITKERLEELIKEGAVIYDIFRGDIYPVNLLSLIKYGDIGFEYHNDYYNCDICRTLSDFYETREEAEWEQEFGCIVRTKRLELPTWEQIENIIDKKKRFGLNHSDRILARIITKDSIYYFKLCKDIDLFTFQMEQTYIGEDLCEQITSRFPVSLGKATKENYTLACRKAKELFLGVEDE